MLRQVCFAAGVGLYNAAFKTVPLKKMLLGAMLLGVGLGSTQLLLVSGYNRVLGLSDELFVLGDSVILTVLGQVSHFLSCISGSSSSNMATTAARLAVVVYSSGTCMESWRKPLLHSCRRHGAFALHAIMIVELPILKLLPHEGGLGWMAVMLGHDC